MTIFLEYLKISLWMIPVLLLALWLLPRLSRKYTARLAYFIWLVIALRAIIPWNFTLQAAPIHLDLPQKTQVQWVRTDFDAPAADAAIETDGFLAFAEQLKQTEAAKAAPQITPLQAACAVWGIGVLVSLLSAANATLRLKRLLRRWETTPSDAVAR